MIVEFVRSSYRGVWQLFRNAPQVTTKGRYVRVPDGTPHFPAPHNLWSNSWVRNDYDPPDPPVLGDVTPIRRPYDKGIPPPSYPPAVVVGSENCITQGDSYPATVAGRRIVGGYDCRCWTSQDLECPPQVPWLWFNPLLLPVVSVETNLQRWKDFTVYGNDGVQLDPSLQPFLGNPPGTNGQVSYNDQRTLKFNTLYLPDDYCTLVVAFTHFPVPITDGYQTFFGDIVNESNSVQLGRSTVFWTDTHNNHRFTIPNIVSRTALYAIRKIGNVVRFYYNCDPVQSLTLTHVGVNQFDWFGRQNVHSSADGDLTLFEGLVFPDGLTDGEFSMWRDYLVTKYNLCPTPASFFAPNYFSGMYYTRQYWP